MESLDQYTVEEVLQKVEDGELSAEKALELENAGKARTTLVAQLKSMIEESSEDDAESEANPTEAPQNKTKVKLIKNIKYNDRRYKNGEEIEIVPEDVELLIKVGAVRGE